jgi:hypothetical protein
VLGVVGSELAPSVGAIGAARPLGFLLFMAWLILTGAAMLRWRPTPDER